MTRFGQEGPSLSAPAGTVETASMTRVHFGRACLISAGLLLGLSGAYMLAAPESWYSSVPGVHLTGPFNRHFVTDIALAYVVSAAGLFVAGVRASRTIAAQSASWPVAHAAYHLLLWFHHGLPEGLALPTEAVAVLGFAGLAAAGAWTLPDCGRRAMQSGHHPR